MNQKRFRRVVSTRLRELRKELGLTLMDVALRCDLKECAISHFENERRLPCAKNLVLLANALNTSTDYILGRVNK